MKNPFIQNYLTINNKSVLTILLTFLSMAITLMQGFAKDVRYETIGREKNPADTVAIKTNTLQLRIQPSHAKINLYLLDNRKTKKHLTTIQKILLDGEPQSNFSWEKSDKRISLVNEKLKINFAKKENEGIAINYKTRDGQPHSFTIVLSSTRREDFYGTGERFSAINQKGYIIPISSQDIAGTKGAATYKAVPFYMSDRGYGLWINSYAEGSINFGATDFKQTIINYNEKELELNFYGGLKFKDLIKDFVKETGEPVLPPIWAMGLWKSRDVYHNEEEVMEDINKMREYDLPSSVLVLDSPWEKGYNDFIVNKEQFPNPEQMFKKMRANGFVPCVWLTPFVNNSNTQDIKGITPTTSTYDEAAKNRYLISDENGDVIKQKWWKGSGGIVDFTNPEAWDWWHRQLLKTKKYGVKAFKYDDGEGAYLPEASYSDGTASYKMGNKYSELYHKNGYEYIQKYLNGDGAIIARSGFTQSRKYTIPWGGDNKANFDFAYGLPAVIVAGQSAALSGMPIWGADIAGYIGNPDKKTYIRWTQFSTFSGFMQIHGQANTAPWDYDQETLDIFRIYSQLRMKLIPYIYQAVHQASKTGMPLMRPMVLAYQNDEQAKQHIYQYMFGDNFLVAPMYNRSNSRSVYLPEGKWINYWNGKEYDGHQIVQMDVPLNRIPLFVKEGSLIPTLPEGVETLVKRDDFLSPDVSTISKERVIEIWPNSQDTLDTWDSLHIKTSTDGNKKSLIVNSDIPRPIKIRFKFQRPKDITSNKGISYQTTQQGQDTIIDLGTLSDTVELSW